MTATLRIKRRASGGAVGPPASLAAAELAFNEQSGVLYYGAGNSGGVATSIIPIAGSGAYLPLTGGTMTGALALAGVSTAPTPPTADNSTQIATTAFVKAQGYASGLSYLPLSGGALTGPLTSSSYISVTGNINTAGQYQIGAAVVLQRDTSYTYFYDASGRQALLLGGTAANQNTHENTTHWFGSIGASTLFAIINSTGVVSYGSYYLGANLFAGKDTNYTYLYDQSTRSALWLGGSGVNRNLHSNGTHEFYSVGNSSFYGAINASGWNVANNIILATGTPWLQRDNTYAYFYDPSGRVGIYLGSSGNTYNYYANTNHYFYTPGLSTVLCYFNAGGTYNASGTWGSFSDIRTKANVTDYTQGLDAVCQLRPITYERNGTVQLEPDGRAHLGFIANEVLPVMPELCLVEKHKLHPDDEEPTDLLMLESHNVVYALVNAVRELRDRVAALEQAA